MTLYKKNICIISSSRAEFGIIRNLAKSLIKLKSINTEVVLIGSHNIHTRNKSVNEINDLNIKKFHQINLPNKNDLPNDILNRSSLLLKKIAKLFKKKKYNLLLVLGDRYEILITSYAAVLHKIPIAHLSGGDETLGSYDNQFRNAITKFSNFHFATNELSKKRILKMGENKKKVYNFGSLSIQNIKETPKISKILLEEEYKIKLKKKIFIVTYHPETLSTDSDKKISLILESINYFKDYFFIFTSPNNDEGANKIKKIILKYARTRKNFKYINSLGQKNYFKFLMHVDGVIGNSSSGVHEVPSFKIGTVNIGNRQLGRQKINSVINVNYTKKDIIRAIKKISSTKFKNKLKQTINPYERKNTKQNIIKKLISFLKKDISTVKKFYE